MAGYSATPLIKKLGIKADSRVHIYDAPVGFAEVLGLEEVADLANATIVVAFFLSQEGLRASLEALRSAVWEGGALWICWPKKASKIATDVSDPVVCDVVLPTGLVDNKVCAIDEVWTGLRFTRRVALRP